MGVREQKVPLVVPDERYLPTDRPEGFVARARKRRSRLELHVGHGAEPRVFRERARAPRTRLSPPSSRRSSRSSVSSNSSRGSGRGSRSSTPKKMRERPTRKETKAFELWKRNRTGNKNMTRFQNEYQNWKRHNGGNVMAFARWDERCSRYSR